MKHSVVYSAAFLLVIWSQPVWAVMTIGCASPIFCTMEELFDGGTIRVHDTLFSGWALATNVSNVGLDNGPGANLANIAVTGLEGDPLNPGLRYTANGEWSAAFPSRMNRWTIWVFEVDVVDGPLLLHDNTLEIGASVTGSGTDRASAQVWESVFADALGTLPLAEKTVFSRFSQGSFASSLSDSAVFAPTSSIFVRTNLFLEARAFGNNPTTSPQATISTVDQRFSQVAPATQQVPEPSTLAFTGMGLVGLALVRRRSMRSRQPRRAIIKRSVLWLGLLSFAVWSQPAWAVTTTGCASPTSCTMEELFDGGTIRVHDKLFSGWTLFLNGGFPADPELGNVVVSGLDDDALNPGLRYSSNGEWSTAPGFVSGARTIWGFEVGVAEGPLLIHDNELAFAAQIAGGRTDGIVIVDARVSENVYDEVFDDIFAPPFPSTVPIASKTVFRSHVGAGGESGQSSQSAVFDPTNSIFVVTNALVSVSNPGGLDLDPLTQAAITTVDQRFSQVGPVAQQVPEPSPLVAIGLGLVGLALTRRRTPKRSAELEDLPRDERGLDVDQVARRLNSRP
jgi:hypothetical protein